MYEKWKICPLYEIFYIESIKSATESAISSWEEINKIVSDPELLKSNGLKTIDLSENIINQAGIISRYFFPSRHKKTEKDKLHQLRAEKLKEHYKIDEDNILVNRKFRNYIEHFDENLDEFLNKSIVGNFIPKTLFWDSNQIDSFTFVFKAYVINEFKFISLSKEIELKALAEEIYRIHNLCIEFFKNGERLR